MIGCLPLKDYCILICRGYRYQVLKSDLRAIRIRFGKAITKAVSRLYVKHHIVSDELPAIGRRYVSASEFPCAGDNMSAWIRKFPAFCYCPFMSWDVVPGHCIVPNCRVMSSRPRLTFHPPPIDTRVDLTEIGIKINLYSCWLE